MNRTLKSVLSLLALGFAAPMLADSCCSPCGDTGCSTIKHFTRRSDSRNTARILMVGNYDKVNKYDAESWYGILNLSLGYAGSFRSEKIADCLFGDCFCNDNCCDGRTINVKGSAVEDRDNCKAWLADYFYLPRNYNGSFRVKPQIKTFFMDLAWWGGFDEWCSGLYATVWGTLAHTRWDLNFCDCCRTDGDAVDHPCGYFSQDYYEGSKLLQSFADYAKGCVPQASENSANDIKWNGLKYAKMTNCARKETGFADLRFALGWNFLNCEDYHLGLNIQFAAPTGDKKEPCYLFDPNVGNGYNWELGGGLTGHYCCWTCDEGDRNFGFWFDLSVTHIFSKRRCRTFDLACKPNSAYMLAARYSDNTEYATTFDATTFAAAADFQVGTGDQTASPTTDPQGPIALASVSEPAPNKHFANEYAPVANLSTINVDVSVPAQVDLVLMFTYMCDNFSWDIGYNFWGRSCEKIRCPDACNRCNLCDCNWNNTWALKGDARMFGYQAKSAGTDTGDALPVSLSATQCGASIYNGLNKVAPSNVVNVGAATGAQAGDPTKDNNANVDAAKFAFARTPVDTNTQSGPLAHCSSTFTPGADDTYSSVDPATHQLKTSNKPVFLNCNSLSYARTKGMSHTLFTHLNWNFECENTCWQPYMGVGASVEFGQTCSSCCDPCCSTSCDPCCNTSSSCCTTSSSCCTTSSSCCPTNNCCDPCCDPCGPCVNCAVSQWSIWVKGGLAYS